MAMIETNGGSDIEVSRNTLVGEGTLLHASGTVDLRAEENVQLQSTAAFNTGTTPDSNSPTDNLTNDALFANVFGPIILLTIGYMAWKFFHIKLSDYKFW